MNIGRSLTEVELGRTQVELLTWDEDGDFGDAGPGSLAF